MKRAYIIDNTEYTFKFGKHVNGTDIMTLSHEENGRIFTYWTTVFDVLPQTAGEAGHMLRSSEWNSNTEDIII